jgi:hypothetical protein
MISFGLQGERPAMPMRWRWPPENSCGIAVVVLGLRPTRSSSSWTRASARRLRQPVQSQRVADDLPHTLAWVEEA